MTPERLLSDKQIAELLGCCRATVWRMVRRGQLEPPLTIAERLKRWTPEMVERLLERGRGAA